MRALVAGVHALLIIATTGCAAAPDPGSLIIRCPDSSGAISVNDGRVTLAGVPLRVVAGLSGPASLEEGMSFVIDVSYPDAPGPTSVSVECVRISRVDENVRWDAVPRRIEEVHDGSNASVRALGRDGPHWRSSDSVNVTVWVKAASGRHVLALGRQPIHTAR